MYFNDLFFYHFHGVQMEEPLEPRTEEVELMAKFAKPRGKAPFHVST